jgi:endonuclease/exonuclease/phosphatase family metal-dependent hydrolase
MRIFFILLISFSFFGQLNSQALKVMTYNIRYQTANDGVNAWSNRKEKVVELIRKNSPDALGVQEALHTQMQDLATALPEYAYIGVGRDDGKEMGEYTAIFYKTSRLKLVNSRSFWLSETPEVPGSIGWDAAITRMATVGVFEDLATQKSFRLFTAHFDHVGKVAQRNSAAFLSGASVGAGYNEPMPTLVAGDFNVEPTEEAYKIFFKGRNPDLFDTRPVENTQGTFCGFEKGKMECRIIDYMFCSKEWHVEGFEVVQDHDGLYYPSDHLPVLVTLSLRP